MVICLMYILKKSVLTILMVTYLFIEYIFFIIDIINVNWILLIVY